MMLTRRGEQTRAISREFCCRLKVFYGKCLRPSLPPVRAGVRSELRELNWCPVLHSPVVTEEAGPHLTTTTQTGEGEGEETAGLTFDKNIS